jgi:cullin-4
MTTVYSILTLPNTSDGLTYLKPTSAAGSADGSGSPPHKVARLSTDYDSASASRSKKTSIHNNSLDGPIQIQIVGDCSSSFSCLQLYCLITSFVEFRKPDGKKELALLIQCIRIVLGRNHMDILPVTYERIYSTCRSAITTSPIGESLYDHLRIELEKAVGQMVTGMVTLGENDVAWISSLNESFKWFEDQIVESGSFVCNLVLTCANSLFSSLFSPTWTKPTS